MCVTNVRNRFVAFLILRYIGERESLHLQKAGLTPNWKGIISCKRTWQARKSYWSMTSLQRGAAFRISERKWKQPGGTVTGVIFAAETFKMPGKFSCCLNALCWSEPEKETREYDTSVLCGSDSSHGDKRDEKPDGLDITKGKCRSERGSHRNAKSEVPEEDNWMPDRTIMHGDEMINLYYGIRGGKRAVVKKEVFPLEGEKGKNGEEGLKEFDIRI